MAIVKITSPLATAPNVFAAPVIAHNQSHVIDCNHGPRFKPGYVCEGARFNIGGALFVADADTAISGTETTALLVKFVVTGDSASASYVSSYTGLTWNGANQGYYDSSSNYHLAITDYKMAGDYLLPGCKLITSTGTTTTGWTLLKKIKAPRTGYLRVMFYAKKEVPGQDGRARIYKNGEPYGTEYASLPSGAAYLYAEDLFFDEGDLVQVFGYSDVASWETLVTTFMLCGADGTVHKDDLGML